MLSFHVHVNCYLIQVGLCKINLLLKGTKTHEMVVGLFCIIMFLNLKWKFPSSIAHTHVPIITSWMSYITRGCTKRIATKNQHHGNKSSKGGQKLYMYFFLQFLFNRIKVGFVATFIIAITTTSIVSSSCLLFIERKEIVSLMIAFTKVEFSLYAKINFMNFSNFNY